jgi:hypothetical protein
MKQGNSVGSSALTIELGWVEVVMPVPSEYSPLDRTPSLLAIGQRLRARDPDIGRCWASRRVVRGPEKRPRRGRGQIPPFNSDLGRSAFLPSAKTIQAAGSRSLASPAKLEIGPAMGTAGLIAAGGSA